MKRQVAFLAIYLARYWEPIGLIVGLAVVAATFLDYGITTDEGVQSEYGELTLAYFRSGFSDRRCDDYLNLRLYGPLFESAAAMAYEWLPEWKYAIRHFAIALTGLLTIAAVIRFGRLFTSNRNDSVSDTQPIPPQLLCIPFFAALGLAMQPQFYGHIFNNSKDIPLACGFSWAMWAIARLFLGRTDSWRAALTVAVLMGLALTTRPASYLPLGGILLIAHLWLELREQAKPVEDRQTLSGMKIAAIFAIAWLIMIVPWPWAHGNPILRPAQAMRMATQFYATYPVLFDGQIVWSDQLPRSYLIRSLAMTTPPLLLAIAGLGIVVGIAGQIRDWRNPRSFLTLLLQLWLLGPIVLWTIWRPNVYDGVRHFLFVLPALALWFAIGGDAIVRWFRSLTHQGAACAFVTATALAIVPDLIRLHPYQMTYHNVFAGGMRGADGRFELDYWQSSYKEGMEWINRQPSARTDGTTRVLIAANPHTRVCADNFAASHVRTSLAQGSRLGPIPPEFDYYLALSRTDLRIELVGDAPYPVPTPYQPADSYADSPIVHRVGREGATFAVIRKR